MNNGRVALILLVFNLLMNKKIFESCRIQKQNKYTFKGWVQFSIKNLHVGFSRMIDLFPNIPM